MKQTSQILLSPAPWHIRDDSMDASLFAAKLYKVGKVKRRGRSPHHLSDQNFTLSPTPTLYWRYLLKTSQPIRILLHKPHPWTPLPNLEVHPAHSSPNFKATTLLQSLFSSIRKRQSHFPSKALLKVVSFLIPKPPLAIGKHTLSQLNKCVLESPHRKSLCSFSILLATCVGMVNKDKKEVGRLDSILLSSVNLPPLDKYSTHSRLLIKSSLTFRGSLVQRVQNYHKTKNSR